MGINQAAAMGGMFIGLVLGGVLAPINWRLIFLVSVPIGLFGTVWGYLKLRELSARRPARIDWPGNITFALGLVLIMVGITYGIEPYGHDTMGWANPFVLLCLVLGAALLVRFRDCRDQVERADVPAPAVQDPRLHGRGVRQLPGCIVPWRAHVHAHHLVAGDLAAAARLRFRPDPFVGRDLAMLPLTAGFLVSGPFSGMLSDRYGARPFATGGMVGTAVCFGLLELLPTDFSYWVFALLLFATGLSMSMFGSPNRAGVMNSLPAEHRGAGSGMNTTFQNSAQVLSIGIFFTLLIVGLSSSLPGSLYRGLVAHGVPLAVAAHISHLPPVSTLFAAFLGYNPVQHLVGQNVLSHLSSSQQSVLIGRGFFPKLIAVPFRAGLHAALDFAIGASLLAALASWSRGRHSVTSALALDGAQVEAGAAPRETSNGGQGELHGSDRAEAVSGTRK